MNCSKTTALNKQAPVKMVNSQSNKIHLLVIFLFLHVILLYIAGMAQFHTFQSAKLPIVPDTGDFLKFRKKIFQENKFSNNPPGVDKDLLDPFSL